VAAASSLLQAAVVEEIVVKINNRIITKSMLEERTEALTRQMAQQSTGRDLDRAVQEAKEELLANLITESLLLERAETIFDMDKIRVSLIEDFRKQQNIESDQALEAALKEQGMTRKELEDHLVRLAVPNEIISYDVKRKISVSETELEEYYERHIARWETPATITLREIALLYGASNREEVRARAAQVAREAAEGADFAELVQRHSEAGTRESQGLLGPVPAGDLLPAIAEAASRLGPGQVGGPIDTGRSFHIIRLEARAQKLTKPLEQVREEVYNSVREEKFRPRFQRYLKRLWKENYIEVAPKYESLLVVSPLKPRPEAGAPPGA
jgi:parvulin-like peptidyl-prolyl isomerase